MAGAPAQRLVVCQPDAGIPRPPMKGGSVLPTDGAVVAAPHVRTEDWIAAFDSESFPLALAPATPRGWFGGLEVVAWAPSFLECGLGPREAADALAVCLTSGSPRLAAALIPYEGSATIAVYPGGVVRTESGWRVWGDIVVRDVPRPHAGQAATLSPELPLVENPRSDMTAAQFRAGVGSVADSIRRGDVYVLNLTRRITGVATTSPETAFASLLARCAPDMGAYWSTPRVTISSASPERFIQIADGGVRVCPIKGTRPRAAGPADRAMMSDLFASEKERAEHVMIVDLVRNDLGRVCRTGSVAVDPLFEIVTTPYCHQMVSTVRGSLTAPVGLGALVESAFPCGSVTGAPKIAAMRIIETLERSSREAYTGSLVVVMPGAVDSSILIRTAECEAGRVRWGTGGGITVDSDTGDEWLETVLKASPLLGDGTPAVPLRETCRVVGGRVPLLSRHLARLAAGGCGPSLLSRVRERIDEAIGPAGARSGRLAVTAEPNGAARAEWSDIPSSLDVPGGPSVAVVETGIPALPTGAAKPLDRSFWDRAHREAERMGAEQAILVDSNGRVFDGSTASVWIRTGRELVTPPAPPAVDGVARGVVFDHARSCGYEVGERYISVADVAEADEVFLSNALTGVVPVRGRSGEAAKALCDVFDAICNATVSA